MIRGMEMVCFLMLEIPYVFLSSNGAMLREIGPGEIK